MQPRPINIVMCDSFVLATSVLSADPEWVRTGKEHWMYEGEQWRVVTEADRLRGQRVDKTREIGAVHRELTRMAQARKYR